MLSSTPTRFLSSSSRRTRRWFETRLSTFAEHGQFALSDMTRYEVMRGLKEKNAARQLRQFGVFCQHAQVYPISSEILDRASDLWVEGRRSGHACRDPDLIIAATALTHGRHLVTGNANHFAWIPGLVIEDWRKD